MRQRIEDLGRLAEILQRIRNMRVLQHYRSESFFIDEHLQNADRLEVLYHQLENLKEELSEAWSLARFGDTPNE